VPRQASYKCFSLRGRVTSSRKDPLMRRQRIDYYDSPEAPGASSLVPAVNVVKSTTQARSC
jgi:hypothetical protein